LHSFSYGCWPPGFSSGREEQPKHNPFRRPTYGLWMRATVALLISLLLFLLLFTFRSLAPPSPFYHLPSPFPLSPLCLSSLPLLSAPPLCPSPLPLLSAPLLSAFSLLSPPISLSLSAFFPPSLLSAFPVLLFAFSLHEAKGFTIQRADFRP
jgi:hypothetical protein